MSTAPAVAVLQAGSADHRVVHTAPASSAAEAAAFQQITAAQLLRSIVVRRGAGDYLFVLVPADREIAWPKLRALLGVKRLSLPPRDEAEAATGYKPGTITPFGATTAWPVLLDEAALAHQVVSIGGGSSGVNIHLDPRDLVRVLDAVTADVTALRSGT